MKNLAHAFLPVLSVIFSDVSEASSISTREWIASALAFVPRGVGY